MRGRPKGDGKTELTAAISLAEFAGPVVFAGWAKNGKPLAKRRLSPDIPIGAASWKQANKLYAAASTMVEKGPLDTFIEVLDTEMQFRDGTLGSLYRVASVGGTNDGGLHSFAAIDETHELIGNKKRLQLILSGGTYKRTDGWILEITTAGARGLDSVAEDAYELKQMIDHGTSTDDETLIDWLEADEHWDLDDPEQLLAAIYQANPAADVFFPVANLVARYHNPAVAHHEFRRYNLNQWVETTGESWLDDYPGVWAECQAGPAEFGFDLGLPAVTAVDFAQKRDGVAIATAQLQTDGQIMVYVRIWQLDEQRIDTAGAKRYLLDLDKQLKLRAVGYDPRYFETVAQDLEDEGLPMHEFPQNGQRMVPACTTTLEVIRDQRLRHNGDKVLAAHVKRAVWRESEDGPRLSKTKSKDRIDGCIAMVMAVQLALTPTLTAPAPASASPYPQAPIGDFFRPAGRLTI